MGPHDRHALAKAEAASDFRAIAGPRVLGETASFKEMNTPVTPAEAGIQGRIDYGAGGSWVPAEVYPRESGGGKDDSCASRLVGGTLVWLAGRGASLLSCFNTFDLVDLQILALDRGADVLFDGFELRQLGVADR
jgi:hypothetical protein